MGENAAVRVGGRQWALTPGRGPRKGGYGGINSVHGPGEITASVSQAIARTEEKS